MGDSRPGTSTNAPEKLCPCVRSAYLKHLATLHARGIEVVTLETLRDETRQGYYVQTGVSRTMNSLHLPQPPQGLSLAYDLVPKEYLPMKGWNPGGPHWGVMGFIGEDLGMQWGGRWVRFVDKPHFQKRQCECSAVLQA